MKTHKLLKNILLGWITCSAIQLYVDGNLLHRRKISDTFKSRTDYELLSKNISTIRNSPTTGSSTPITDPYDKETVNNYFISPNFTIVQAQTLTTAVLHCEISFLGNSTVTWKRRRSDLQILTFGLLTYSSDIRFFTRNMRNGKDWSLHIRYVNPEDAGMYECQISSHPPSSIFIKLELLEAHAEIMGGPEKLIHTGSPLVLACIIRRCTEAPEYIFWYRGNRMINYDDVSGNDITTNRVSLAPVGTSESPSTLEVIVLGDRVRHHRQGSELVISRVTAEHAGNYTCVPSKAKPASVIVHVLQAEKSSAMQHDFSKNNSANYLNYKVFYKMYTLYLYIVYTITVR